ncbi:DUF4124 domain-containing protein [Pseudomonas typographi]|uniref:DUF4124 domain-containing protein n=1 Tax=Pseudomonas typographi TaxID=2715964 RepID=UPI001682ED37|nr:DUF4124 domain-containing protein [Pseudomonas typographi]MBD1554759.1 DUF4124 domain-containing protein [Pseudomonas typographi]
MLLKPTVLVATLFFSAAAGAAVFKCVAPDGKITFASVPCAPGTGTTTFQEADAPLIGSGEAEARLANERNRAATRIMQTGRQGGVTAITVVPDHTKGTFEDRRRQAAKEARQARIAAGLESPSPKPVITQCFSYGSEKQFTNCTDSSGGHSSSISHGSYSNGIYYPGQ